MWTHISLSIIPTKLSEGCTKKNNFIKHMTVYVVIILGVTLFYAAKFKLLVGSFYKRYSRLFIVRNHVFCLVYFM